MKPPPAVLQKKASTKDTETIKKKAKKATSSSLLPTTSTLPTTKNNGMMKAVVSSLAGKRLSLECCKLLYAYNLDLEQGSSFGMVVDDLNVDDDDDDDYKDYDFYNDDDDDDSCTSTSTCAQSLLHCDSTTVFQPPSSLKILTQEESLAQVYGSSTGRGNPTVESFNCEQQQEQEQEQQQRRPAPAPAPAQRVRFSTVEVHYHSLVLGDHPCVSSGPPIALSWKRLESDYFFSVDEYESSLRHSLHQPPGRSIKAMGLAPEEREWLLLRAGVRPRDISLCVQRMQLERSKLETQPSPPPPPPAASQETQPCSSILRPTSVLPNNNSTLARQVAFFKRKF